MNRLFIIGAGGHGKVIADIALKCGYTDISFLDDNAAGICMGVPIRGGSEDAESFLDGKTDFIIGIGSNSIRKKMTQRHPRLRYVTLVHPAAVVGSCVSMDLGTAVMAGAVINPCSRIGAHCIVNTGSVIEHDNILSDFVHISPGALLGGTVCVGEETHVGIGAVVKNNIEICSKCVIGAGAAVMKNISVPGVYVGVPAARLDKG